MLGEGRLNMPLFLENVGNIILYLEHFIMYVGNSDVFAVHEILYSFNMFFKSD